MLPWNKRAIKKGRRDLWSFVIRWKIWQWLQLTDGTPENFSAWSPPSALSNWVEENSLSRELDSCRMKPSPFSEAKTSVTLWAFLFACCSCRLLKHSSRRVMALVRCGGKSTGREPGRLSQPWDLGGAPSRLRASVSVLVARSEGSGWSSGSFSILTLSPSCLFSKRSLKIGLANPCLGHTQLLS